MSHDPQSPTDAADFDDDDYASECEDCGEFLDAWNINVEAFEMAGHIICEECFANRLSGDQSA